MTDVELEVADSFERVFPVPTVVADWDDVLDRAGARSGTPTRPPSRWRVVAIAVAIVAGAALLATPALGIGDRLLSLIQGKQTPLDVQAPAWSRDGRTIVFVSWRDGNGEVYAMDADGSGPRNLTQNPAKDVRPAWSPDGRTIAFVSRRDGNSEVYVMNADGSGKRNLTRDRASDDYPTWSPDGRRIAFLRGRLYSNNPGRPRRAPLLRLPPLCRERRRQRAPQADAQPDVSLSAGLVTGRADDLLRALSRQDRRERSAEAPVHPVDRRLVARRAADRLREHGQRPAAVWRCCPSSSSDIYVMNADGSGSRRLTHKAGYNSAPAWSPDGRRIVFQSTRDGNREIYVMNADGSGKRNLTRHPARDGRPSWSPDGRRIAFVSDRDGRLEAHVMNADGSGQRSLTQER